MNKLTAALLSRDVVLGNCHQIGNKGEFEECEMCQLSAQLSLTPQCCHQGRTSTLESPRNIAGRSNIFSEKKGIHVGVNCVVLISQMILLHLSLAVLY